MKRNKRSHLLDDAKQPSDILLNARLRSGAGKHQASKAEENKRTGRLQGSEKAKFRRGDYD